MSNEIYRKYIDIINENSQEFGDLGGKIGSSKIQNLKKDVYENGLVYSPQTMMGMSSDKSKAKIFYGRDLDGIFKRQPKKTEFNYKGQLNTKIHETAVSYIYGTGVMTFNGNEYQWIAGEHDPFPGAKQDIGFKRISLLLNGKFVADGKSFDELALLV